MILTKEENIFLLVLVINLVLAVIYLLYGLFFSASSKQTEKRTEKKMIPAAGELIGFSFLYWYYVQLSALYFSF